MKNLLSMLAEKKNIPFQVEGGDFVYWDDVEKIVKEYMTELEKEIIKPAIDVELNRVVGLVKKLEIKNGDFLLVRAAGELNNNNFYHMFAERLRYMLDKNDLADVTVLLIGAETGVELLDEKMMMRAGWLKKEKVDELLDGIVASDKFSKLEKLYHLAEGK
jgi:hypothetical protein